MWNTHIIHQDGTISTKTFTNIPDTLGDITATLLDESSEPCIPGIIYKSPDKTRIDPDTIEYIVLYKLLPSGYPEAPRQGRPDTLHPITITPNTATPAIWETSATHNRPEVTLICNHHGRKKRAIYINQYHHDDEFAPHNALIAISMGDYVIKTYRHKDTYSTTIYLIKEIHDSDNLALLRYFASASDDIHESPTTYERLYQLHPHLKSVVRSSKRKAKKGPTYDIHFAEYQHLLKQKPRKAK
jgi:hypothetical protein